MNTATRYSSCALQIVIDGSSPLGGLVDEESLYAKIKQSRCLFFHSQHPVAVPHQKRFFGAQSIRMHAQTRLTRG